MSTTPSVETFLAERYPDDDLDDEALEVYAGDPLQSIAQSLSRLTEILVRRDAQSEAEDQAEQLTEQLDRDYAELLEQYQAKAALLEKVLVICKPSTSKLANAIRAAVEPEAEPVEPTEPAQPTDAEAPGEQIVTGAVQCPACLLLFVDNDFLDRHECKARPANDAPVEDWRAYAKTMGHEYPYLDTANRSQIRTMLGISHSGAVA